MPTMPAVTSTPPPAPAADPHGPEVHAFELEVDAEIPEDFDWDAIPEDHEPMPFSDDEDTKSRTHQRDDPPHDQPNGEQRQLNGHARPSARGPQLPSVPSQNPQPSRNPQPLRNSQPSRSPQPRSDGVVADPMGVDGLEDGEIDQKKNQYQKRRKKKKKQNAERLHCDVCDIFVTGQVTMDSHLMGQKHLANARQAALRARNKEISDHGKAILSQNRTPREPRKPEDEWESKNSPPKPVSSHASAPSSSAEHRDTPGVTEVRPPGRDPYAPRGRDPRSEAPRDDRHSGTNDPRTSSRDSRPSNVNAQEKPGNEKSVGKAAEIRPGRDPYAVGSARGTNEQRLSSIASSDQNGMVATKDSADEVKKRKRSYRGTEPGPVQGERNPSDEDRERRRGYEATGDGVLRRKLSDGTREPRERNPNANRDMSRQPAPAPAPAPAPQAPAPTPPTHISRPLLVSAPAPVDTKDDRRSSDPTRRFTYGSVRRESIDDESTLIPYEWLTQPMDTNEWRELRNATFNRGDDVDRLAFKMLQEILLSPVLGISTSSLAPFSRGMLEAVRKQYLTPENAVYARFEDYPNSLSVRNEQFARGDPEWQKTQSEEQMAIQLVGDNIVFCLNSYEDSEAVLSTEPHNFPRRGSFGQKNMVKSSRDGGLAPRYRDSVEQDRLFNDLYNHLLRQRMGRMNS